MIPSTVREAVYLLDEILGNPTELPIAEHATDTAGQTLAVFGLFDLLGLRFSPPIRDLTDLRRHRLDPARTGNARWPHAGPLLTQPIPTDLIVDHWDELLRLAGTMKFGHHPASLLIARLHAGARRNTLARALHEHGRLVRTVFALRYLTDLELPRRVQRQLNKDESLHALRRRLLFAHQGHVRRRHLDDQLAQPLCLTLLTNAVVLWNTLYLQDALDELRRTGHPVTDDAVAHLSPARDDHLNPYRSYTFDVDADLGPNGRRPLRRPSS